MADNTNLYSLDKHFLNQCKKWQKNLDYSRTVNGNSEAVSYLPGSSIRFWVNDDPIDYDVHWHPAIEIVIPLENTYTIITSQAVYELVPGDIFVIPGGELHHLIAPPTGERLIYLFDFSLLSQIRGFPYLTSYLSQPLLINRNTCKPIYKEEADIIGQLCRDYFSNDSLRELIIYAKLITFFVNYVRFRMSLEENARDFPAVENKQKDLKDKFNLVFDYLDEHYAEDLTLEKVANVAGFSKFHFSRLFKQCSGYNFCDYLCYKRIKSAEMLLTKPNILIAEIALQSGFSSLTTFNRTFKKIKGCTPSEYRNLFRSQSHHFPQQ